MVAVPPEQVRHDAERLFRESALPESFEFFERLSPLNQRLFVVELWDALSKIAISQERDSAEALVHLISAWEATADLDAAPEVAELIRRKKNYRQVTT